jgi:hyperosmotically inducible protein
MESNVRKHTSNSALIVASAALWFVGGATAGDRTAGEHIDDAVITAHVKTALIGDARTKAHQVDVETFKGAVQLNGFVDSAEAKAAAGSLAKNVEGVESVKNNLQIGADRTAGRAVDDKGITAKVRAALIDDPRTKSHQIEVTTNDGRVQLGGFVDTAASKAAAEQLATNVAGVTKVTNKLQVRPN